MLSSLLHCWRCHVVYSMCIHVGTSYMMHNSVVVQHQCLVYLFSFLTFPFAEVKIKIWTAVMTLYQFFTVNFTTVSTVSFKFSCYLIFSLSYLFLHIFVKSSLFLGNMSAVPLANRHTGWQTETVCMFVDICWAVRHTAYEMTCHLQI